MLIPEFSERNFHGFTLCGRLDAEGDDLGDSKVAAGAVAALHDDSGVPVVCSVVIGGTSDTHLHVDYIKKEFFDSDELADSQPKPIDEVLKILDSFIGKKIKLNLHARFSEAIEDLPEEGIVALTFFEAADDDFRMTLTAGEVTLTGGSLPLRTIRWAKVAEGNKVLIDLDFGFVVLIDENYLVTAAEIAESAYRAFVLGRQPT